VRFDLAIDAYLRDQRQYGRINSDRSERSYRICLNWLCGDVSNRDPRTVGRDDIKSTLGRWPNPNTQRSRRSVYVSFFDWCMEEGLRPDNPARQTHRPRKQPTNVYRLTMVETSELLRAARSDIEKRIVHLGACAGLRRDEIRGMQGRHFRREGFLWVSADIAKGGRERWVPVIADLQHVWEQIAESVEDNHFVVPAQRGRDPPRNTQKVVLPTRPASAQFVWRIVIDVARRAGIKQHIHPHLLRHAFGDHIARHAGLHVAQALLGHATVDTTASTYVGKPTLDELAGSVTDMTFHRHLSGVDVVSLDSEGPDAEGGDA
jgi:site-specific recombinase XerD